MSQGIYQAIGYKEFKAYLDEVGSDRQDTQAQVHLFREAVANMQMGTRQYARRQVKWIRNKFLPAVRSLQEVKSEKDNMHVYCLDATDLSGWQQNIQDTAIRIADGENVMSVTL